MGVHHVVILTNATHLCNTEVLLCTCTCIYVYMYGDILRLYANLYTCNIHVCRVTIMKPVMCTPCVACVLLPQMACFQDDVLLDRAGPKVQYNVCILMQCIVYIHVFFCTLHIPMHVTFNTSLL